MSNFKKLQEAIKKQFDVMTKDAAVLYSLNLEKNELWDIYIESFPEGTNKLFRERREHDCSCCRHFIRAFGDVVTIKDGKVLSIWDIQINDAEYDPVLKALSKYVKTKSIQDIFISKIRTIGVLENHEDHEGRII